jgi:hypothetical protein
MDESTNHIPPHRPPELSCPVRQSAPAAPDAATRLGFVLGGLVVVLVIWALAARGVLSGILVVFTMCALVATVDVLCHLIGAPCLRSNSIKRRPD